MKVLCSKCNLNPRAAKHRWCAPCKAEYMRPYMQRKRAVPPEAPRYAEPKPVTAQPVGELWGAGCYRRTPSLREV